ncbi:MAG: cytochrome P450, partial [Pseudomonadota bacterium]
SEGYMEIDLLSPSSFADGHPYEQYRWLRDNAPIYRHEEPGGPGFWVVSRYTDVRTVGRDPQRFSSEPTISILDSEAMVMDDEHKMMLMMDPPMHTEYRNLISREFTQGAADGLSPRIQQLAQQIVDEVIERGECDFVSEVAGEMPSYVIAELMGLPLEDGRKLYELTEIIHSAAETLPEGAQMQAVMQMFAYASEVIKEKRAKPTDDLASKLLHAEVDGKKLDDLDFQLFFMLLIDAGGDTTRNLVSGGLLTLLEHPGEYRKLQTDLSGKLASARDELLRWVAPVVYMRRTATQDTELAGQQIREGDKVVMYYGSANRDERDIANPDVFDISRHPNLHLSFGRGPHVCMGQYIARVEIDAMLHEVISRMHDIEIAETPEWLPSNFISGPRRMPVKFAPGKKLS